MTSCGRSWPITRSRCVVECGRAASFVLFGAYSRLSFCSAIGGGRAKAGGSADRGPDLPTGRGGRGAGRRGAPRSKLGRPLLEDNSCRIYGNLASSCRAVQSNVQLQVRYGEPLQDLCTALLSHRGEACCGKIVMRPSLLAFSAVSCVHERHSDRCWTASCGSSR